MAHPTSAASFADDSGGPWKAPSPAVLQDLLQGYEVLELIGRGGMGAVYKARQNSLDRLVAIKVLPPDLWDDEDDYTRRFRNEARLMAKLMHPGMIAVFDFGEMRNGLLYIVMEYVEGTDVARMLLQHSCLDTVQAVSIAAHVCDTLAYAHEHGIIHRDIKPANVMVDMEGRVKVADFGLAKHTTQDADESHSSKTMGTPDYVAPESLLMGVVVDGRADLYSLGVMLYEMLTGQVPRGFHPAPSEVVPGLDHRLDAIIARVMQWDPLARYQKAAEFRKDLNHVLTVPVAKARQALNLPGSAPRPGPGRKPAPAKVDGTPWGMMTLGVLVVAAGIGYVAYQNRQSISPIQPRASASQAPGAELEVVTTSNSPAALTPTRPVAAAEMPPEVIQRLGELDSQYRGAIQRDVTLVQEAALRDLDGKYLAALDRAVLAAAGAGNNAEAVVLNEEKNRLSRSEPLPATDPPDLPPGFGGMRRIYRTTSTQIEADAARTRQGLQAKYEQVLKGYQEELAQAGQALAATEVGVRLAAIPKASPVEPAAPSPVMPVPAPVPPTTVEGSTAPLTGEAAKLQQFLTGTSWRWRGLSDEPVDLLPDGKVYGPGWESGKLVITWQVQDRRRVQFKIVEGRTDNIEANLIFAEDLKSFSGTDFSGKPFRFDGSRLEVIQATPAFLEQNAPFAGRVTFPAGEYRLKHQLVLGAPDPVDPKTKAMGRLFSTPGSRFTGGSVFIDKGVWTATGTLFTGVKIAAEWGASFKAENSLFSNSNLGKGGGWYGDYFSSKWTFDNCVITGSFIPSWKITDIGVKINQCTFHDVQFPAIRYRKDAGKEVARDWMTIQSCRFVNCKIPESLLIATKDCVFEGCTFGLPESDLLIETPVKTTIYVNDRRTLPVTGPDRQLEVLDVNRVPQPAGANFRYGKNGMTLNFQ